MAKKRKIDFIISKDNYRRLIFRFYPRRSSCHSFNDETPKNWNEVYKVYYSYAIIQQYKFESEDQWKSVVVFREDCDECSIIDEVGYRCLLLADGVEVYEREDGEKFELLNQNILPFGMGTDWTISKHTCTYDDIDENDLQNCANMAEIMEHMKEIREVYYTFMLFNYDNKGYKFTLEDKDIKAFGEYLLECCDYMLAHGDPI